MPQKPQPHHIFLCGKAKYSHVSVNQSLKQEKTTATRNPLLIDYKSPRKTNLLFTAFTENLIYPAFQQGEV